MKNTVNLIILFLLFISTLAGQESGKKNVYTVDDCIKTALKNNYDIQLTYSQIKSAGADVTSAFGSYLPSIEYQMSYTRNFSSSQQRDVSGQDLSKDNLYYITAQANYNIFDGFSREAVYNRAQENITYTDLVSKQTIENVKIEIYRKFLAIVQNSQIVKIRRENIEQGKNELERIQAQYDAGVIPVTNLYSQQADLGGLELELVKAENQYNISKADLMKVMGLQPDMSSEFLESSISNTVDMNEVTKFRSDIGSYSSALKRAMDTRMDYSAAKSKVTASGYNISMAQSGYMPRVSANGGWSFRNYEFSEFNLFGRPFIGLNLSVPIFENFQTNAQIQQANLGLEQSRIEMQRVEQNIRAYLQSAYFTLDASEKQLEISEKSVKFAELNYESTKERYHVGAAAINDMIVANTLLINSQINRVSAVYGYILAQKELLYSIGSLN